MSVWKCNACGGTYSDTTADGSIYMHVCGPKTPDAQGVQAVLPNRRDETLAIDSHGIARDIKLAGAGVTAMQGQTTAEPQWIIQMRASAATIKAAF